MTSNSYNFIESSIEIALVISWETLKEYMSDIEDYLRKTTEEFETDISEQKKNLTPEQHNQFDVDHLWGYVYYYDEFPYILRNSFLVSAYSLFEHNIGMICRNVKNEHKIPITWSDLMGNLLERAKKYFKLAGLDLLSDNPTWEEIDKYAKIRHCIVHRNGLLKEDYRYYKEIIEYVKTKGLIKQRTIIFDGTTDQAIGLTKEFCEKAVGTFQNFVRAVYKASMTKG